MADLHRRQSRGTSRALWILILVLLTPAVVVPLLVPLYDQLDPTLFGFPFFFWFQFALIVGAAIITLTAFVISTRADARDRAERRARRAGR
jgi:hypothetical protein